MDLSSKGITLGQQQGHLNLLPQLTESLICQDPITDYFEVEQKPFARGKFAAVRRARCLRTGELYAAKVVRKRRRATDVRPEALHEAAVLSLLREHPKIVKLHSVFESLTEMTLVLEMASGGELHRVIDEEEHIEESVAKKYLNDILSALRFLHSYNIAHLDLKPQNLLLTGVHPDSEVKLCDFGISRLILSDIEVREVVGTPDYVAPEILQYEPISLATDMWSVGVLTYVLLTGHSPFGGDTKQQTFLNISQCDLDFPEDLFEGVSLKAQDFISELLLVDPSSRLTVKEAINHPWLCDNTTRIMTFPQTMTENPPIPPQTAKRANSGTKLYNKENDKNLINNKLELDLKESYINECDLKDSPQHDGSLGSFYAHTVSPPSKRECRESVQGEQRVNRSVLDLSLPSSFSPSYSSNFPDNSSLDKSPKVSEQIQNFEKKIQSVSHDDTRCSAVSESPEEVASYHLPMVNTCARNFCSNIDINISDAANTNRINNHEFQDVGKLSVPSAHKHFCGKDDSRLERRHSLRKSNLNRSFGSVDYREAKDKVRSNLRLSPLCLRRDRKKCDTCPKDQKFGSRRELQEIVRENSLIY